MQFLSEIYAFEHISLIPQLVRWFSTQVVDVAGQRSSASCILKLAEKPEITSGSVIAGLAWLGKLGPLSAGAELELECLIFFRISQVTQIC